MVVPLARSEAPKLCKFCSRLLATASCAEELLKPVLINRSPCLAILPSRQPQAFTMTFFAEWGDRSQIATIALGTNQVCAVCARVVAAASASQPGTLLLFRSTLRVWPLGRLRARDVALRQQRAGARVCRGIADK